MFSSVVYKLYSNLTQTFTGWWYLFYDIVKVTILHYFFNPGVKKLMLLMIFICIFKSGQTKSSTAYGGVLFKWGCYKHNILFIFNWQTWRTFYVLSDVKIYKNFFFRLIKNWEDIKCRLGVGVTIFPSEFEQIHRTLLKIKWKNDWRR